MKNFALLTRDDANALYLVAKIGLPSLLAGVLRFCLLLYLDNFDWLKTCGWSASVSLIKAFYWLIRSEFCSEPTPGAALYRVGGAWSLHLQVVGCMGLPTTVVYTSFLRLGLVGPCIHVCNGVLN